MIKVIAYTVPLKHTFYNNKYTVDDPTNQYLDIRTISNDSYIVFLNGRLIEHFRLKHVYNK